jgi:methyltransferase (TIGR00027 family)
MSVVPVNRLRGQPRAKKSAEGVASLRFLGSFEADPALRNPDRAAGGFIAPPLRALISATLSRPLVRHMVRRRFPGAIEYQIARTKHFDRALRDALDADATQVVILGAGYDTRASRFRERLRGIRVLEVDHPATVARKRSLLTQTAEGEPRVGYVPLDFEREDLAGRLTEGGFSATRATLFLWEGVTMFITAAAVQRTLSFVAGEAAPGSTIVFDYVAVEALERPAAFYGGLQAARHFSRSKEPWRYGVDPERVEELVGGCGLRLTSHYRAHDLQERYLTGSDGVLLGRVPDFHGVVTAARV